MTAPQLNRTASILSGLRTIITAATGATVVMRHPLDQDPDALVCIVHYPIDDDMQTGTVLQAVQVMVRGSKTGGDLPVLNTQDDILDLLGNLRDAIVGGIHVMACWRNTSVPITSDDHGRSVIRDTYYLRTDRLGYAG